MSQLGTIGDVTETDRRGGGFSIEWKIPDFLSLAGESGDSYGSPAFNACNERWIMAIYPYGIQHYTTSEWVSLHLVRSGADSPETLRVSLGIRGPAGVENKKEISQEFSKDYNVCHWIGICNRSKLEEHKSRLMLGKVLVITIDVKSDITRDLSTQTDEESKQSEVTKENQSSKKQGVEELQKSLQRLLQSGEDCDVILKVQGKEFPAHRAILRVRSPVFQAMFTHDMVEKQSGKVTMEDCDSESFTDFLEHVYTGSVDMISSSNVINLYAASDKYDLSILKKECTEFMKQNLTVASFCNTITLAIKHSDKDLIERATAFFCNNSLEIAETAEWQTFLQENSTVGNELFIKTMKHNRIK